MVKVLALLTMAGVCGWWSYKDFREGNLVIGTIAALISPINVGAIFL